LEKLNNNAEMIGVLGAKPEFSHVSRGEEYSKFPLEIERLSGAVDVVNVLVRKSVISELETEATERICVKGEIRSFNNKTGIGNKLIISVFAQDIYFTDEMDKNLVELTGVICKEPNFRKTPMGREICDLMLAVGRKYGKSDYLPCIVWGRLAQDASEWSVGTEVNLTGRLQSRKYIKNDNEKSVEKTAYEISVVELSKSEQKMMHF